MARVALLTVVLPCAVLAVPPFFVDLPDHVQERFASDNFVRPDYKDLPLQAVVTNNGFLTTRRCGARTVSLADLEPSPVISEKTECYLNGLLTWCPGPLVFAKQEGNAKITVSMNSEDPSIIDTVQVIIPGCGAETFLTVEPGYLTSIPAEAYDDEALQQYHYGEEQAFRRSLRTTAAGTIDKPEEGTNAHTHRKLQEQCPNKAIKVAVAFDSSYCQAKGGYDNAVAHLETTVVGAAALYEGSTCLTLSLSHVEGYCDPDSDPYKEGVDLGDSGCNATVYGMLDFFQEFWAANRQWVDYNVAHFAGGTAYDNEIVGCAYQGNMCYNPPSSVAVLDMSWTTNQALLNGLLAHENGHLINSLHDDTTDQHEYVMEPAVNEGSSGFSSYSQGVIEEHVANYGQGCLDAPPTSPPTQQPTKMPTFPLTPHPTKTPTPQPTNFPTPPPTAPINPACLSEGQSCAFSSQCCSKKCKGPNGRMKCKSGDTTETTPPPTKPPTIPPTQPIPPPTPEPTKTPTQPPTPSPQAMPNPPPTPSPQMPPTPAPTKAPTPTPTKAPTKAPTNPSGCLTLGNSCTSYSDCCSNKCKGKSGAMTCKNV